jgi:hypothetical protein
MMASLGFSFWSILEIKEINMIQNDVISNSVSTSDEQRAFVLSVVQPGLAGLMDGSISSLAPLFAAAFATRDSHTAFLVGLATAIGTGISMGFSEGLSDDGKLSGRGNPWVRGGVCGLLTFLGALGHTLPFLIPAFLTASLLAAGFVRRKYGPIRVINAGSLIGFRQHVHSCLRLSRNLPISLDLFRNRSDGKANGALLGSIALVV